MTIIVTGGAGFIGSNFVFHMLNKYPDYRIVCLDCLTYAGNLSTLEPVMDNPNFRFVKESITDREAVYKLFEEEKPDMVVNFAAESHVDRSIENPEVFLDTNIKGTAVLMDACRKYGIKRYHQVSTDEVYGDLPLDRPDLFFTEETPIHTSSPYSSSKAAADLLVLAYHRTYGLPVSISRCSNNYGPYHFPEKLIPLMKTINQVSGPMTDMFFLESIVGMTAASASGQAFTISPRAAGGSKKNHLTPICAWYNAAIFKGAAGLSLEDANRICKEVIPKFENDLYDPPKGCSFRDLYNISTLEPIPEYKEKYLQFRQYAKDLGIPIPGDGVYC